MIHAERGYFIYQGEEISPSEAAKFVRDHMNDLSYIPGQVQTPGVIPLSSDELRALYLSNQDLTPDDEKELEYNLHLELADSRALCSRYWKELMSSNGAPEFETLDKQPELIARNYIPRIQKFLNWYQTDYIILMEHIKKLQIPAEIVFSYNELDSEITAMEKALHAIDSALPRICDACDAVLKAGESNRKLDAAREILKSGERGNSVSCVRVLEAMTIGDPDAYAQA